MNLKYALALLPFIAIIIGLYVFSNVWITTAIYHGGMLITILVTKSFKQVRKGWSAPWGRGLIGGSVGVGLFFLFLMPRIVPTTVGEQLVSLGLGTTALLVWIVYFSLVNPFLEEPFWRRTLGSDRKGIAASDVLYAGYHLLVLALFVTWPWLILEFIILLGAAYLFRQCVRATQGLLIPLLAHLIVDISVSVTIFLLLS
jgi:hypothetical protein